MSAPVFKPSGKEFTFITYYNSFLNSEIVSNSDMNTHLALNWPDLKEKHAFYNKNAACHV